MIKCYAENGQIRVSLALTVDHRAVELLCGARIARRPVGRFVQGGDHHQQVAALGLEHADRVVAPFIDDVAAPVKRAQSPLHGPTHRTAHRPRA